MSLGKCSPCLDKAISEGRPVDLARVPDAVVLVTLLQNFTVAGGQQVAAPGLVPACLSCRQQQLGTVSKAGLMLA